MKKPSTTTLNPFDYDRDYYYYYMNGPVENWQYVDDEYEGLVFFNGNDLKFTIEAVKIVSRVTTFIGFFSNLLHFFFLTRKELRCSYVFIVMIGICICDILIFLYPIGVFLLREELNYSEDDCTGGRLYHQQLIEWIAVAVESIGRKCSTLLALFMTLFRTVSVMFPMNGSVQRLSSARCGIFTVLGVAAVCVAWETVRYGQWKIKKLQNCDSVIPTADYFYILKTNSSVSFYYVFDGYFMLVTSTLYVVVASALILELKKAHKRRKKLKTEKSDGTTNFVMLMTISFFLSGCLYGAYFIFDFYVLNNYPYLQYYTTFVSDLTMTLTIVNSTTHCFICFFMSTQYRDTVKRLVWKREKQTTNFVEPATISTVKTTKSSGKNTY